MTRKVWKQIAKLIKVEGKEILREETTYKPKVGKIWTQTIQIMHADDECKDPYSTYQAVTDTLHCKISTLNGKKTNTLNGSDVDSKWRK